jgi:hypothetical protein
VHEDIMRKVLAGGAMVALTVLSAGASVGATDGTIPPSNPQANIAPSSPDWLTSIDSARADEGVGPMQVPEAGVSSLSVPEQVFLLVNRERIDRGLPAIGYMTTQLDDDAAQGAQAGTDPPLPSSVTGGQPVVWAGSIWAGGTENVFESDYYWMYSDGWGGLSSPTSNIACAVLSGPDCWGHRDIILQPLTNTCGGSPPTLLMGAAFSPSGYSGGSIGAVMAATCGPPPADASTSWSQLTGAVIASSTIAMAILPNGQGYWEVSRAGAIAAFGQAVDYGSMAGHPLSDPIVGMASTPDGGGYWLVASDGGIFSFGDASFYGSTGSIRLNKPIVGMASTPSGHGYWLVASDGGIFSYGDARFAGSTGSLRLNQPVVGMALDPATGGYWLVAADGGIFSFDAPFYGSTGAIRLNQPIEGMGATQNGLGYRFVASDGGVFSFGQAPFNGSMGGQPLPAPIVSMVNDNATGGYWLADEDGDVYRY